MSSGDEVSINNAIAYAYNNDISTVSLSAKTYVLRNPVYIRSGITLKGQGKSSTIITIANGICDDSSSYFYIPSSKKDKAGLTGIILAYNDKVSKVCFHDFSIDGNRDNQYNVRYGKGYFNEIQLPNSNNVEVYNMNFYDTVGDGVRVYGSKSVYISGIYVHDCSFWNLGHDCCFFLRANNAYVYNCSFTARTNSSIRYQDIYNGYIYNNKITAYSNLPSGPGLEIAAQYRDAIKVEIYSNTFYNVYGSGVQVVSIRSGNGDASSESVSIHNNVFYRCGAQTSLEWVDAAGVSTEGINHVNIFNNAFCGCMGGGVYVGLYLGKIGGSYSGMRIGVKNNIFISMQLRNKTPNSKVANSAWGVYNGLKSTHYVDVGYNCFYKNVSGDIANASKTEGNFNTDPKVVSWSITSGINNQDYHLKSKYGRYKNGSWVKDNEQSPCIDKGDPTYSYSNEPEGNGDRINIGMYGNTSQASLSSGTIKPKLPYGDFVATPTSGKSPLTVKFTDLSTGDPTYWKWDFGDEGISTQQNPTHKYYGAGLYDVRLYVSNSAGSDTYTVQDYIKVLERDEPDEKPEAAFTYTPAGGIAPLKVKFTDKSSNNPTSWAWNFGDGTTSTSQNPTHTYAVGTYDVQLTATNSSGSSSITKVDAVTATSGTPIAKFSGTPVSGNVPLTVQFTDKSLNTPTSWKWNFGDRISSTKRNPEHIYSEDGKYTVTLTVTNAYGSNTTSKSKYITVILGNPFTGDMYDNRLLSTKPNNVYSGTSYIDVGKGSGTCRTLLWFNLDDYKNKTFKSVKLCLYWYGSGTRENDTIVEVYRPSTTWDPENVSWNYRMQGVKWNTAGVTWYDKEGDLQGTIPYTSIRFTNTLEPTNTYYELDVTQLVNEYVNGKYQNFGFLLKAKTENSNYIKFYSLESGTNLVVPYLKLIEEEEAIPVATKLTVAGDGSGDINCDGRDDQIQINQAIKLVYNNPSKYSGVFLKGPFNYNISEPILTAGIVEGDSTAVVKLVANAGWKTNIPLFKEYKTSIEGITLKGFTIDGNRDNNKDVVSGKGYYDLIAINSCSDIAIYDMKLMNGHNNGVYVNNCSGVAFYNNDVQLMGYDGFFARNCKYVDTYTNIVNCRINNGIHVYNTDYVNAYDNIIYSEGTGAAGIYIEKYGTVQMVNIYIYNNTIHDTMYAGILAIASSSFNANSGHVSIHNNRIYNCGAKSTAKQSGGVICSGFNAEIENQDIDNCYSCGIGVREVNGTADITGTVSINIRSNNIVYTKRDASNNKGYGLDYDILPGHDVRQGCNCMYQNAGPNNHNVNPSVTYPNVYSDPLFADHDNHNYSLKSIAGRLDPVTSTYVSDSVNSPCIDAGYPEIEISNEPEPNGGIINIGSYGNTIYASLTGDHPIATNHTPVLEELTNKVVEISNTLNFTLHATDEDNDTLSYTMTPVPSGATLGLYTGVFEWTPSVEQEGTYAITFTVSDGYLTDSQTINIGVIKGETVSLVSNEIIVNLLRESDPTVVYNILPHFSVGGRLTNSQNKKYRTLIITDLTSYYNKTITSAILSMCWYYPDGKERGYDTIVEAYRPVAYDSKYTCWNNRIANTAWTNPGGDWYDKNDVLSGSVPFGSLTFTASTLPDHVYHDMDITELVQKYCNGTYQNTGILLKAQTEDSNFVGFYSQRMLNNVQLKLTINYTD